MNHGFPRTFCNVVGPGNSDLEDIMLALKWLFSQGAGYIIVMSQLTMRFAAEMGKENISKARPIEKRGTNRRFLGRWLHDFQ